MNLNLIGEDKKSMIVKTSAVLATLSFSIIDANTADICVECKKRSDRPKISSSDNHIILSSYSVKIASSNNIKSSTPKPITGDGIAFDPTSHCNNAATSTHA